MPAPPQWQAHKEVKSKSTLDAHYDDGYTKRACNEHSLFASFVVVVVAAVVALGLLCPNGACQAAGGSA